MNHSLLFRGRVLELFAAVAFAIYLAFKKYSHDRIILCEAIGVSIFAIGIFVCAISGFPESSVWIFVVSGVAAVFCGLLAIYFGLTQWLRQRKPRV